MLTHFIAGMNLGFVTALGTVNYMYILVMRGFQAPDLSRVLKKPHQRRDSFNESSTISQAWSK